MSNINIVSMIKINGEWVEQSTLPKSVAAAMIADTILKAAKQIGFEETGQENSSDRGVLRCMR